MMRRYIRDRRANVAILFAFSLPAVVGFCGLGTEVGYWYYESRNLQAAADMAAYDGAIALRAGNHSVEITAAATAGATTNGWVSNQGTIVVNNPPQSGNHQTSTAVEVVLTKNVQRLFTGLFTSTPLTLDARAVASVAGGTACILALNGTATHNITVSGSANINTPNCDVVSDSNNSDSIDISGSANVTTSCLVAVGDINQGGILSLTQCKTPTVHAATVADPYASVPTPSIPGACLNVPSGSSITLSPGYYCHGLSVGGSTTATFQPGLYYVDGGNLALSGTRESGSSVTFYVVAAKTTAISGSTTVNFSAPTSGTYAGIVFFGSRTGSANANNNFSGSSASTITGAIYYPSQIVTFSGGSDQTTSCTQVIGNRITISGAAHFSGTCSGSGMQTIADGSSGSATLAE